LPTRYIKHHGNPFGSKPQPPTTWWCSVDTYKGCKHDQIDKKCSLSQKITNRQFFFSCIESRNIILLVNNMKIKFHFNIINLKDEHFHIDLSRFYKIAFACRKCPILQNGLQIDEIWNIFYFQVMKALKILVYYKIIHVIIIIHKISSVKVGLNIKLTQSSSNLFLILFMIPKFFKFCIQLTIN
jgi:hypothetical protein